MRKPLWPASLATSFLSISMPEKVAISFFGSRTAPAAAPCFSQVALTGRASPVEVVCSAVVRAGVVVVVEVVGSVVEVVVLLYKAGYSWSKGMNWPIKSSEIMRD